MEPGRHSGLLGIGGLSSTGYGVNNDGDVAGRYFFSNPAGDTIGRAFLWDKATASSQTLALLGGDTDNVANALSDFGQLVGISDHENAAKTATIEQAFIWQGGVSTNLNSLIDPSLGWNLQVAQDISSNGKFITGWGVINGHTHAYLLCAIGEPCQGMAPAVGGPAVPEPAEWELLLRGSPCSERSCAGTTRANASRSPEERRFRTENHVSRRLACRNGIRHANYSGAGWPSSPLSGEVGMHPANLSESLFPALDDQPLRHLTIGAVLREAVSLWPDSEALVEVRADGSLGRRWTFAALLADSERLARALLTRFHPGERITVWGPNTPEWVLLEFGLALAGLVLVTANPGLKSREIAYVLGQSGSVGLFVVREHRGNPLGAIAAEVAQDLVALREITDMEDMDALFAHAGPERPLPDVDPLDPAQIQYTSGTTGFPKGVTLHHKGLINNSFHHYRRAGAEAGDPVILMMPLFHTAGCALGLLGGLQTGCRTFLIRQFDPKIAFHIAETQDIAAFLGVPTMFQAIAEVHEADPRPLPSLRVVGSGGAMVPPELVRDITRRFGCGFSIVYGQTESSPLLTMTEPDDWQAVSDTVGPPMPHLDVAIFDLNTGTIAAIGTPGEIRARGYALMLGYHENPEATAVAIDAEGWLHTGDIGTMDAQGFVRVTGRVKEIIIRGGENLFPVEIENVLLEHPDVAEVAVVGVPCPRFGEVVAAFVRPVPGRSMDPTALKAHCRDQIAAQKTPAHWIEVNAWPLTGSGKIQKFELRRQWEEAQAPIPA